MIVPVVLGKRLREGVIRNHISTRLTPYQQEILHRLKKKEARVEDSSRVGGQVKENISSYFIEMGLEKNF